MDRQIEGRDTGDYLWSVKGVVPFLKVDKGLADEADGVQVMKPMPASTSCSAGPSTRACSAPRCARSSSWPTTAGVDAIVDQQFEVGRQILGAGPGADHRARGRHPQPREGRGRGAAQGRPSCASSTTLPDDQQVMLKLTLPEEDGFYAELVDHPKVAAGRRAVRRLQPRRGQRAPGPQPRRHRQLLAGAHRGALGPAERRRVRRHARRRHQGHLRGLDHLRPAAARCGTAAPSR